MVRNAALSDGFRSNQAKAAALPSMIEPRKVDVAYMAGRWLAEVAPDYDEPLQSDTFQRLIDTVQRDWPDQALIFVVNRSTTEGDEDAEAQFVDASEKSGALVISSGQ